ncbi:MAG: helix-turn-helix domain-containing protein [Oscillospiraceae bacterium]|nr:helix-turn-helix domain-containing protein [Oscillospiraceae bacterium]
MTIGEQIQKLRIEKGLTQERFAEFMEVSRQSISKWELGQAVPDVDKIIRMSELFDVSTDTILLRNAPAEENKNSLHLGSVYLVVKDFEKSVDFYEKFFGTKVENRCRSGNKFVEFYIDNKCISLMNENNIHGHCTDLNSPYKFLQNYWVEDLTMEYERVKSLNIGKVTEILEAYPTYHYFHLTDPDNNIIEITGGYHMDEKICQSCGMKMQPEVYGKNADGSPNSEYCKYCWVDGHFSKDETMEEMIESNLQFLDERNKEDGTNLTPDEARAEMMKYFPNLKRWRTE